MGGQTRAKVTAEGTPQTVRDSAGQSRESPTGTESPKPQSRHTQEAKYHVYRYTRLKKRRPNIDPFKLLIEAQERCYVMPCCSWEARLTNNARQRGFGIRLLYPKGGLSAKLLQIPSKGRSSLKLQMLRRMEIQKQRKQKRRWPTHSGSAVGTRG